MERSFVLGHDATSLVQFKYADTHSRRGRVAKAGIRGARQA
jgi:hypothetical protein